MLGISFLENLIKCGDKFLKIEASDPPLLKITFLSFICKSIFQFDFFQVVY